MGVPVAVVNTSVNFLPSLKRKSRKQVKHVVGTPAPVSRLCVALLSTSARSLLTDRIERYKTALVSGSRGSDTCGTAVIQEQCSQFIFTFFRKFLSSTSRNEIK